MYCNHSYVVKYTALAGTSAIDYTPNTQTLNDIIILNISILTGGFSLPMVKI